MSEAVPLAATAMPAGAPSPLLRRLAARLILWLAVTVLVFGADCAALVLAALAGLTLVALIVILAVLLVLAVLWPGRPLPALSAGLRRPSSRSRRHFYGNTSGKPQ